MALSAHYNAPLGAATSPNEARRTYTTHWALGLNGAGCIKWIWRINILMRAFNPQSAWPEAIARSHCIVSAPKQSTPYTSLFQLAKCCRCSCNIREAPTPKLPPALFKQTNFVCDFIIITIHLFSSCRRRLDASTSGASRSLLRPLVWAAKSKGCGDAMRRYIHRFAKQ